MTSRVPARVIVGVAPDLVGMSHLADQLEAEAFLPGTRALDHAVAAAAQDDDPRPLAVVLPMTSPRLIVRALRNPDVDRLAVYHWPGSRPGAALQVALRAVLSFVDLVITPEDPASAVRLGADPDRVALCSEDVLTRLVNEPRRTETSPAKIEALASVALDAAQLTGALRLAELVAPDRGVNVVNYHRILPIDEHRSYGRPQMALPAPVFEAQLAMFERNRGFAPLTDVRDAQQRDRVAITFDDGYEDNFRVALPLLQRFGAPACIFVVTGLIDQDEELWWDAVGRALFEYWRAGATQPLPEVLRAHAAGLERTRSEGEAQQIITDALSALNDVDQDTRDAAIAAAAALTATPPRRTMMTWDEVSRMNDAGVDFGSHTRSHVCLDEVPEAQALDELFGAQSDLEAKVPDAHKITALPRGKLGPLNERQLDEAFDAVMTTEAGVNSSTDDSLFVKRRDGKMLTLRGRHHPAKLRLELTGLLDRLRALR